MMRTGQNAMLSAGIDARSGAPERIRTSDLCLRRAALYPAELRVPVKTQRTLSISFSVIEALYCNHGCFCILLEPQWSIAARESVNILTAYRYSDMPFHTPEYWNICIRMQLRVFENVHPWRAWQVYKLKRWMSDDNRSS
jgi:hypothetical protein